MSSEAEQSEDDKGSGLTPRRGIRRFLPKLTVEVLAALVAAGVLAIGGVIWTLLRSDNSVTVTKPNANEIVLREGEGYELEYDGPEDVFLIWEDPAGDLYPRGQATFLDGIAAGNLGIIGGCFDFHNGASFVLRIVTLDGQISSDERTYLQLDSERPGPFNQEGFDTLRNHLIDQASVTVVREVC